MFRVLRLVCITYAAMLIFTLMFADSIIFQPHPSSYRDSGEIIKLTTADGMRISAVYPPNPHAYHTILHSHGNGEDLGDILPTLKEFHRRGFSVFSYDYHGYGTSGGRPSEKNAYLDIEAAYSYLTRVLNLPPEQIIIHGYSVGSGPSVELATRRPVGGLVLEEAFTTALRVVTQIPVFPFDHFRNIDKIGRLHIPVLIIHGRKDHVIPFSHGKKLYAAANEPKYFLWIDGASHYDYRDRAGKRYWEAFRGFAANLRAPGKGD